MTQSELRIVLERTKEEFTIELLARTIKEVYSPEEVAILTEYL